MNTTENVSSNTQSHAKDNRGVTRIIIAGVGDGGCNVLAHMTEQSLELPKLALINTDAAPPTQALSSIYLQIGKQIMKGIGTGGDPRVGRRAAEIDTDSILELCKDVDLFILIAGLGGGTGTGAAPIILRTAANAGALTLCFAILPFDFEGKRRMENAKHGLMMLQEAADGVICMPNQRLFKSIERNTSIANAFKKADDIISKGVYAIWREMCRNDGVKGLQITFDDLRTLMTSGNGRCVFACVEGSGQDKIEMALQQIKTNPLLEEGYVMKNANSFLISLTGGADLSVEDVNRLVSEITASGSEQALIKTGVSFEPAINDKVFVTILVSERDADENQEVIAPMMQEEPRTDKKQKNETKLKQVNLFDMDKQGRFKGTDPTIVDGNNLDTPTFIRRGILIQKSRSGAF